MAKFKMWLLSIWIIPFLFYMEDTRNFANVIWLACVLLFGNYISCFRHWSNILIMYFCDLYFAVCAFQICHYCETSICEFSSWKVEICNFADGKHCQIFLLLTGWIRSVNGLHTIDRQFNDLRMESFWFLCLLTKESYQQKQQKL